mmetsp:Transcript_40051/g.63326  ORF Transcript_40051/g.63326 Transcript_40051/m.63326 type:complete len:142 (-) Transcript_40051:82-507(-)|eukprot:CAMPEP_0201521724 /NCGR_PEP_ID=MMETSP0161_2-20130828/15820_1 /ASSEMBLY_ACC=CAM_ASM_000251 /TAXON_ID=180227 /ORGANISM="Neoparamoeba aestuarina, Strain SoJaBio B1-5/56/2" /LENGTH=141 /DNA_ID=CAMNT_0047920413 /DNA_START=61 /DNA_END=486 /DNA_ORIENTATION=+
MSVSQALACIACGVGASVVTCFIDTNVVSKLTDCSRMRFVLRSLLNGMGVLALAHVVTKLQGPKEGRLNFMHNLESKKVSHKYSVDDIEDGGKKSLCRCWKSKKFPLCDGAHNQWNKETGDNVGPVTVTGKVVAEQYSRLG